MQFQISNFKFLILNKRHRVIAIRNWKLEIGNWKFYRGQALITLLFFSMIALTLTTGAVAVMYSNSLGAARFQRGGEAYEVAQSGAENAILRLLRNPAYTGETLAVGTGTATIQVTNNGGGSYTILSTGTVGNSLRKVQVDGTFTNGQFAESARREVY